MATKKYLSLDRLTEYDALLKAKIADSDASTLESAKGYADEKLAGLTSGTTEVAKATEATHATSADTATNATNATKAEEATHATSADTATNANHATSADRATNATNAEEATHAVNADKATNADNATKATQDASGNVITETYETKADSAAKLTEAKGYADTAASNAANQVKNDLLNGAGEAYDTLKELGDLINEKQDAITALEQVATNKADKEHDHTVADITDYVAPVQSDWNQNDETALDYVKNRPCYFGDPVETYLINETTVNFPEDEGNYNVIPGGPLFEDGQAYTVVYDGTTYECTAWADPDGMVLLGNGSFYDMEGGETEAPFFIEAFGDAYCITTSTPGDHTISVSMLAPEAVQLDEKFISYKPGRKFNPGTYNLYNPLTDQYEEVAVAMGGEVFNDYMYNFANDYAHAEGTGTIADGLGAHAEGGGSRAMGRFSHAEGDESFAYGDDSHAEGQATFAEGDASHAEGSYTRAGGHNSHAEGNNTIASGLNSHAEGFDTIAASDNQHVQGVYNIPDEEGRYAHIVGNGELGLEDGQSNAHTLDWNGNAWFAGDVYVGGDSQDDASKLITEADFSWNNLQDRPFGEELGGETVVLEETSIDTTYMDAGYAATLSEYVPVEIGQRYVVTFDGTVYECDGWDCVSSWGARVIGNSVFLEGSGGPSNNEPFAIMDFVDSEETMVATSDGGSHVISISIVGENGIKTIETKYLPEHLQFGVVQEGTVDITNEVELLPSTRFGFYEYPGGYYGTSTMGGFVNYRGDFNPNNFYRVTWDGVEYYCSVFEDDSYADSTKRYAIGSPYSEVIAGTSEYPFNMYFIQNSSLSVSVIPSDTSEFHDLGLDELEGTFSPEVIAKIDPKYLPEMDVDMSAAVDESKAYTDESVNTLKTSVTTNTSAISANTSSIQAHTTAIGNLQTAVAEFEEITSAEITALFA